MTLWIISCASISSSLSSAFAIGSPNGNGKDKFTTKTFRHRFQTEKASSSLSSTTIDKDIDKLIPLDFPRRDDVLTAVQAVRQACRITESLQPLHGEKPINNLETNGDKDDTPPYRKGIQTVRKADLSPVTVVDYAVQALVLHLLAQKFPDDGFIAEEDSQALLKDRQLCQQVVAATASLSQQETLKGIDLGKSYQNWKSRPPRVWCLDPIDGTKGFLRGRLDGGQYAIALALVEEGVPTIGILGCPNLAWSQDDKKGDHVKGCLFVASQGGGCYQLPLHVTDDIMETPLKPLKVTPNDASTRPVHQGRLCVGVERFSDALGYTPKIAALIQNGLDDNGEIRFCERMDSQAKHGVIARGDAEYYMRLPKPGYVEWIWDHAAGYVVITEAGGQLTDTSGGPIDFSLGPQLSPHVKGVLMSNGGVFHQALIQAYQQVHNQQQQQQ